MQQVAHQGTHDYACTTQLNTSKLASLNKEIIKLYIQLEITKVNQWNHVGCGLF